MDDNEEFHCAQFTSNFSYLFCINSSFIIGQLIIDGMKPMIEVLY